MKGSFLAEPTLSQRVFGLLDVVFPGVPQVAQNARALGASWESVSTPFVHIDGDRVISHIGVIEIPLVLHGKIVRVGSIHAVATHPSSRRRGHYGQLMEEILHHDESRYETLILTTEHPEYFQPFGFRYIQEHLFTVKSQGISGRNGMRLMDMQDANDIALLHRLLEAREPVSHVVGVVQEKAIFCFNEGSRPLHYIPELEVMVCLELEGTRLRLLDIVGPKLPTLAALLEQMSQPIEEVAICFSADRLAVEAQVTPDIFDHDGPSYLMVRGPFVPENSPFTLPRSART
jgi:GNAT superfamily N-acetyltransferase